MTLSQAKQNNAIRVGTEGYFLNITRWITDLFDRPEDAKTLLLMELVTPVVFHVLLSQHNHKTPTLW